MVEVMLMSYCGRAHYKMERIMCHEKIQLLAASGSG